MAIPAHSGGGATAVFQPLKTVLESSGMCKSKGFDREI